MLFKNFCRNFVEYRFKMAVRMKSKVYFTLENFEVDKFYEVYKVKYVGKRLQSREVLERKSSFLIHNLISRQVSSHNDTAYLNAEVLKNVLGGESVAILDYLVEEKLVRVVEPYVNGVTSKGYRVVDLEKNVSCSTKPYFFPYRPYVIGIEEELAKREKLAQKSTEKNLTKPIYKRYQNSLNKLRINPVKAKEYIDIHFREEDKKSRHYHLSILEEYQVRQRSIKVPNEIDNRIYHILTRTPREFKNFLNIKFQVDIRNSHPLLLTALIYERYGIRQKRQKTPLNRHFSIYRLSQEIKSCFDKEKESMSDVKIHLGKGKVCEGKDPFKGKYNVGEYICNKLKDIGLKSSEINKIRKIPFDVLRYIYLTSTGGFWDKVLEKENGKVCGYDLTRQDVKGIMFGQVFYGKNLKTPTAYKYARQFKEEFPNVYSLILSYKEGLKKEERTVLAHKLMALESKLFRKALTILFEMGFEVVSIHDAIVVLDTPANKNCSVGLVKSVLTDVYKEEGLVCECSVDIYGERVMEEFLESERELRRLGNEFICDLRKDESKKILVKDYENGKSEIIWDKEKKNVILHPKNIKDLIYKQGA